MRARFDVLIGLAVAGCVAGCGGGNGKEDPDNTEALAYVGMAVGNVWNYDVEVGAATLDGRVEVVMIDGEYRAGVEAYKLEIRQNQLLISTRWYQVTHEGMFLLGEQVQEGVGVVERTFLTPLKVVPYPLVSEDGILVQSWTTDSDMEEGGSERHRFDNSGEVNQTVPAGTFSAYHLIHTRTDKDGTNHQYAEYFAPTEAYVQFEYPENQIWRLTE